MTPEDKNKLSHEAILKELHKADDLVEMHSGLIIAISGAAFGFAATHLEQIHVVSFTAVFGILVAIEWILKIIRHRQIFMAALNNLRDVENNLDIKTARPNPYKYLPNGFTTLLGFAILLIIMWGIIWIGTSNGWFNQKSMSASQVVEEVSRELPTLSNLQNCKWIITSMVWDEKKRTYDLIAECSTQPATWLLTYDTSDGRVIKAQRK